MENKKQLIIIPPMSESLRKLHEVLEGIAEEENIEVSLIDDLRELSQFLSISGQCLIIASNAKKCATLLQENKAFLMKNNVKTILFTPKEIPAKTLVKFTKLGLTESVLENLPPKTFIYKVRLLLRSIKTAKAQEEAEKLVKFNDAQSETEINSDFDTDIKKNDDSGEQVIDLELSNNDKINIKNEEDVIDYTNQLKSKIKPQEEIIDSHWKSNRKINREDNNVLEENSSVNNLENENNFDSYYRGKLSNNSSLNLEIEEESKPLINIDDFEPELKGKSKGHYQEVIDNGSMKQKKLSHDEGFEEIPLFKDKKDEYVIEENDKTRHTEENPYEKNEGLLKTKSELSESEVPTNNSQENLNNELSGYYKGKISQKESELTPKLEKEEKEYDNSDLYESEKKKSVVLDIESGNKKNRFLDEDGPSSLNPYVGEIDHIDNNMSGKTSTSDKIKNSMEGQSEGIKEIHDNDEIHFLNPESKILFEPEDKNYDIDEQKDSDKVAKNHQSHLPEKEEENLDKNNKKEQNEELTDELDKKNLESITNNDLENNHQDPSTKIDNIINQAKNKENKENQKNSNPLLKDGQSSEENKKDINQHTGKTDKIDGYYRGGTASKKDLDWDNVIDANNAFSLATEKNRKRIDEITQKNGHHNFDEQIIDYRKLKEEFDQIALNNSSSHDPLQRDREHASLKNNDDIGSFKVFEANPVSMDFAINIINSIYKKDLKPKQIYQQIAQEVLEHQHGITVFYSYKLSEKKFIEVFNSYAEFSNELINPTKKELWYEFKKDTSSFELFQKKTITTWRCPEIIKSEKVWEDVELPSWAEQELQSKSVELIFPYFDGIDRMGMALVFFPEGINVKSANGLLTTLEMARALLLDTIERYKVVPLQDEKIDSEKGKNLSEEEASSEKKGVLGFISGIFGKKKAV